MNLHNLSHVPWTLIFVLAGLTIAACSDDPIQHQGNHKEQHHEESAEIRIPSEVQTRFGITTAVAGAGEVAITEEFPGEIVHEVDRIVHVHPRFAGVIMSHRKHIGEWVDQGDVLVTIESNEGLSNYEVKAPISGLLVDGHAHPGEAIGVEQELYTISDTRQVWVELQVFPSALTRVRKGQSVKIDLPTSEFTAHGTITFVNPTLDTQTRTATARIVLPNPDGLLQPGLFVTGTVTLDRSVASIVVPSTALVRQDQRWSVFVERPKNTFIEQPVRPGRRGPDVVEIVDGLAAGTRVVVDGTFLVKSAAAKDTLGGGHHH